MMLPLPLLERNVAPVLGMDIGGANIKLYHTAGHCVSLPFAMWLQPTCLANAIVGMVSGLPKCEGWGVTMTGELADVFDNRAVGVKSIVQQTMLAATEVNIKSVGFYSSSGNLLTASQAIDSTDAVASANWHALALWASTWVTEPTLLIDIGSTTADIIPITNGYVATLSRTDHDRLRRNELVYVGIRRTPVCSLVDSLPLSGLEIPVMREVFATTDDCALLLGWTAEVSDDVDSCDSRPRTCDNAANRLARMVGLDRTHVTMEQAIAMASRVMQRAAALVSDSVKTHASHRATQWIISGHASPMINPLPNVTVVDLAARLGTDVSRVAPAYAICELIRSGGLLLEQVE